MIIKITEEMETAIAKIADTYGVDPQMDVAIEEMAELTKALLKLRRVSKDEKITEVGKGLPSLNCLRDVLEEIADVQIMLLQLIRFYDATGGEKVQNVMSLKIARQLERIAAEKNVRTETDNG